MSSVLLWLLLVACLAFIIWLLHNNQRRRSRETAELNTPLPRLEDSSLPDFGTALPVATSADGDNWQARVRSLRESGQLGAALDLCRLQYPRTQAFQQAAVILRQQIREAVEPMQAGQMQAASHLLRELYRTAALADLFRATNPHKPADPRAALEQLLHADFNYAELGHQQLKLLNKSDTKAFEQLWGSPSAHRHAEEVLGETWLGLCSDSVQQQSA